MLKLKKIRNRNTTLAFEKGVFWQNKKQEIYNKKGIKSKKYIGIEGK